MVCYRPWVEPWRETPERCTRCMPYAYGALLVCSLCTLVDAGGSALCMTCIRSRDWEHLEATYDERTIFRCRLLALPCESDSEDGES